MNFFKDKIQNGTVNVPGILLRAAILWFVLSFLVFPNVNLILNVFIKDGEFTLSAVSKILSSARALKSLKNSFILACAAVVTVNITGVLIVLFTEYFDIKGARLLKLGFMSTLIYGGVVLVTGYKFVYGETGIATKVLLNIFPNMDPAWFVGFWAVLFRNIKSYDVFDEFSEKHRLSYDRGGKKYGRFPDENIVPDCASYIKANYFCSYNPDLPVGFKYNVWPIDCGWS